MLFNYIYIVYAQVVNAQQGDETQMVGSLPYQQKEGPTDLSTSQTVEIDKVKRRKGEDHPGVSSKVVFKN